MGRIVSYKYGENSVGGVDPRLWDIVQNAIAAIPYDAQIRSGAERGKGDKGNHSGGYAVDVTLIDPKTGAIIPDTGAKGGAASAKIYEQYAQAARVYQTQKYPELDKTFRWGGGFRQGYPFDLMHLDITPKRGGSMAYYDWDKGFTQAAFKDMPSLKGQVSSGLGGASGRRLVAQYEQSLRGGPVPPGNLPDVASATSVAPTPMPISSELGYARGNPPPLPRGRPDPQGDLIDLLERRSESKRSGIIEPGNIDLNARQIVRNEDGSISTEKSFSFEEDGVEVLIPTVFDGKHHSEDEAVSHYRKTGEHLGKFTSPEAATAYAHQLHDRQDARYNTSDPVEEGATKGDLLDFLKVRAETMPAFDRMPDEFADEFVDAVRPDNAGNRLAGRPFANGPPAPPAPPYPRELVAGLTPPEIGADPLADGSWVNLPTDEARKLLEQSMDVRPRPERLAGRPVDPTITMEFERPGSQPAQQVASVPQGVAAPVPQQTIVATEPRPERLAGRPFMLGATQPAPAPMPASGAVTARAMQSPASDLVRTAMLPSGKPVEIGRSYQISGETYIGGVDASGRGTLNKADAGILKEAGSGTIVGDMVDSEINRVAASGLRQVRPAVSSAFDTISSGASEVFGNVGDKLGEWFGGSKAEAPATRTIRVRNPAYKSVIAPVPVEQTVMLDRFGIPTGEVGSRGGTAPVPQSRPNVPEFIEITVPGGSAPVPATMSAAARAGRSSSAAPRPASRSFRPVVAPRPATMSADLAARRDTAGSGMGGLVNVIGALLGTNARSPTRAPIPYQRGSGQSAQRAIYGSGGSNYGSSPGQMTAGLAPGDRVYNPDTNSWGLKR